MGAGDLALALALLDFLVEPLLSFFEGLLALDVVDLLKCLFSCIYFVLLVDLYLI